LLYVYFRHARAYIKMPVLRDDQLPQVTVQLPLYNERYVACRVIEVVTKLDYPRHKLHIQILDDSTDDTTALIEEYVSRLKADGWWIDHIRRTDRAGYKGGALANGLTKTTSAFIAVFDADFMPRPDFLRKTVPYFMINEKIGVVQGRWGHLNADDNLLTRSQAMMLDGHFAVEQYARSNGDLIFSFNGTCGLWRRQCIEDAGGWGFDTLAEDADLSYRAQIKGWKFVFLRDVVTPGEISPQMSAFKQQQARWAKGMTQVYLKIGRQLIGSNLSLRKRLMGVMHLSSYPIQLIGLAILFMMPLMVVTGALNDLPLAPLGLISLAVPLLIISGQAALYPNWIERCLYFPALLVFSTGLVVNNSIAVISALRGAPTEFKRTPKFNLDGNTPKRWRRSQYAVLFDKNIVWEIAFGLYSLIGLLLAAYESPGVVPYFLLYVIAFFSVAGWSLADYWLAERAARRAKIAPRSDKR
jgi:cellulose synthase/poly-beta-1,6-N-acetylglucosamine synthase-like glycosyltransferase